MYYDWLGFWPIFICLILFAMLSIIMTWLTLGGAIGMIGMGSLIYFAFDLRGLFIIFLFFLSSNLIEKFLRKGIVTTPHEPRTLKQVFANGTLPLLAAMYVVIGGSSLFGLGCFLASIAEATADTWASEAGTLKAGKPYHIALRSRVEPGLSGAVTAYGSAFGGMGTLLIGGVSAILYFSVSLWFSLAAFIIITVAGWVGQWVDTILGAYLQARYKCNACGALTDHTIHCEKEAVYVHGYAWMTNNVVNGCSSIMAGLIGGICFLSFLEGNYFVI